jgi:quercetin dioxygenase-like cupin family protein
MRTSLVAFLFGTAGSALFALASPSMGETIPISKPLVLAPCNTGFVQDESSPDERIFEVTGAMRRSDCGEVCVSGDLRADLNTPALGRTPAQPAAELENVKLAFQRAIPTIPGKTLTAVVVSYPPGGKSPPHRHAKSAFIYAFVLSGAIRTGIGSERPVIYQAGDSFYEEPGAHHTVSENASATKPASLLAVFILDADDHPLTLPDAEPSAEPQ